MPAAHAATSAAAAAKKTGELIAPAGPQEQEETGKQVPPGVKSAQASQEEPDSRSRFTLAPIIWGGNLSETLRRSSASGGVDSLSNTQAVNMHASSYIWQPWIAQVNGGVGMVTSKDSSGGSSSRNNTLTGNGALSLFGQSRFPFGASFDVSDSRTSTASTGADYTSKRINLRQSYTAGAGHPRYAGSYDRSTLNSQEYTDVVSSIQGNVGAALSNNQSIDVNARRTSSSGTRGGGLDNNTVTARHSYRPDSQLSVDSNASLNQSDMNSLSQSVTSTSHANYLQASTAVSWRPDDEEIPLYVNGGGNFFEASSEFSGVTAKSQSMSGNIGANYTYSPNLSLGASGNVARTSSGGRSNLTTTQNGNASYRGDPIDLGDSLSYNWNTGGSLFNQTSRESGNNQRVSGTAGHNLSYPYMLAGGRRVNLGASQSLTANADRTSGSSKTLSHNGTASWNAALSETLSGSANLSASDMRSFGDASSHSQFIMLSANGNSRISAYSSAAAGMNMNWNHQGEGQSSFSTNSNVSYNHSRAFGVRGLRYGAIFNVNTTHSESRLLGDADAQRDRTGYSLSQNLDYRIGRLNTQLAVTYSRLGDTKNATMLLQIWRDFGS